MKKLLLKLARMPVFGNVIGWCIAHLAHVLPLRIVKEDENCVVFHHPSPSYDPHLLAMLKAQVRDISCASSVQLRQILDVANAAVQKLNLAAPHIMLWTNGGRFQEVRQLHFHIFTSNLDRETGLRDIRMLNLGGVTIRECTRSERVSADMLILDAGPDEFACVLPSLIDEYQLEQRGYSVFWDLSAQGDRSEKIYIRLS